MQNACMAAGWEDLETPAERLRWARAAAGYDVASAAARAMGVPEPTYLGHENDSRGFSRHATRYALFYRVSLDWLLTGRGSPKGRTRLEELYDELGPEARRQALEYLEFLRSRQD
jgi:hypothetical protein